MAVGADGLRSWADLAERAGEPEGPRVIEQRTRLFGQGSPKVRLWHDTAAWDPFGSQCWSTLEEMRVPYERCVLPLAFYRKPGQVPPAEYLAMCPDGGVPAIQVWSGAAFGEAMRCRKGRQPGIDLSWRLQELLPEHSLVPRGAEAACRAQVGLVAAMQNALYHLLATSGGAKEAQAYVQAMDALERALGAGPFLAGARPGIADAVWLPMLERAEVNVPHPRLGASPRLALARWPAASRALAAARAGQAAYGAICSDAVSTLGVRLTVTGQSHFPAEPPAGCASLAEAAAAGAAAPAAGRRDATARLCRNHAAVAGFALAGRGIGRPRDAELGRKGVRRGAAPAPGPAPGPSAEARAAADEALRATAASLLREGGAPELAAAAAAAAEALVGRHGAPAALEAAGGLQFLTANTGVPRDMGFAAAAAFRPHLSLVAHAIFSAAQPGRRAPAGRAARA